MGQSKQRSDSAAETEYLLHLKSRLKYLNNDEFDKIDNLRQETAKTLFGLINSVAKETRFVSRITALATSAFVIYGLKLFKGL